MQEDLNIDEYSGGIDQKKGWKAKLEQFLESKAFFWVVILLVAVTSFCFGRVSKIQSQREPVRVVSGNKEPVKTTGEVKGVNTESKSNDPLPSPLPKGEGTRVVGSKNGTKYHLPSCPGAKQISEENKITFNSIEEAKAKGYTAASNCKGLK